MDTISLSDINGAEITSPTPSNRATELAQSVNEPSFLRVISYFWYINPSWLIRPVSKSKLLFSGSQGFYLLFQCQPACFPGILMLSHCKNHRKTYVFFFPCLFQKYLQLVQTGSGICCLSKPEPILRIYTQIFICS